MNFELNNNEFITYRNYDKCSTIPTFDAADLSYPKFFENFMCRNLPCLIKNVSNNWNSTKEWVKNGHIHFNYMQENYGHTNIIIYNCSERYYNSQKCEKSVFSKYVDYWRNRTDNSSIYYLKDWHLKLQCRNSRFYDVPIYFASDWLNEYFLQCQDDDYRFVYMGPKGSWTPLHIDVFSSYSWSVNICGNKKWIFIPPNKENDLKDNLNNLIYNIDEIPTFKDYIEVLQGAGDAIFVPTGWYHQVWNLEDTISINHNWINGCNIESVWYSLKQTLENVEKEITDCKDMHNFEDHCQAMLNSLFGMDYNTFYNMLACIAHNRIAGLSDPYKRKLYHGYTIGINHTLFDLKKCSDVLQQFVECDYVKKASYFREVNKTIHQIQEVLRNNT